MSPPATDAAVGCTVKSGWASVVLVARSDGQPYLVDSRRVELSDPATPDARQPYHAGFGTARASGPGLSRLIAAVNRFGRQSVTSALRDYHAGGYRLRGAGVVCGSLIDPAQIANDHIRIHAMEGQLFRTVVQDALVRGKVRCSIWRERDLHQVASGVLKTPEAVLRRRLAALGQGVDGPWRAEQKAAALAAWLVLAQRSALAPRPR